jgi:hypothetical protein
MALWNLAHDASLTTPIANQRTDGEGGAVTGFYLAMAAALLIGGGALGVLIVICLGIHREERGRTVTKDSSSRVIRGTRRLNGVGSRGYESRAISDDRHPDDRAA